MATDEDQREASPGSRSPRTPARGTDGRAGASEPHGPGPRKAVAQASPDGRPWPLPPRTIVSLPAPMATSSGIAARCAQRPIEAPSSDDDVGTGQHAADDAGREVEPAAPTGRAARQGSLAECIPVDRWRSPAGRPRSAPGTAPTTMNSRSSARSPARRVRAPATTRHAAMTAASASVCQRTTRSSVRRIRGSKSNAMTAIGTVPAVYPKAGVSAGRHLTCRLVRRQPVPWATPCVVIRWLARGRTAVGGQGRSGLGARRSWSRRPAHGGTGRTPRRREGARSCRTASPFRRPCASRCSAGSRSGRAPGRRSVCVGRHAYALLTILALTLRPRTREAIAADLWPDTAVAATGPLRQALYQLRAALLAAGLDPEAILESDAETLGLRPEAVASLDVIAVRDLHGSPRLHGRDRPSSCTPATWPRASPTIASRPSASAWPIATRMRSRPSPRTRLAAGDHDGARQAAERLLAARPARARRRTPC